MSLAPSGWDLEVSPFHEGERVIQQRLGVEEKMNHAGRRGIRRYLPDQHREFFPQLPFIVAGAVDDAGQPWTSLLCNPPGFIQSPDPVHLTIAASVDESDPLYGLLATGVHIGLLGIQSHTRRRNRVNGRIVNIDSALHIEVMQSFGNCPKYIQARYCEYELATASSQPAVTINNTLDEGMLDIIHDADMFFIASASPHAAGTSMLEPQHGVDVSHRGGKPGFIKVHGNSLLMPDYIGNFFFNTLGNLSLNPRAGLVFIDFNHGSLLHLAVDAQIVWNGAELAEFPGAQRLLQFIVKQARHVHRKLPLRWTGWELSPHLAEK